MDPVKGGRPLTGVIGELCAINFSSNPATAIRAWRSDPGNRYDFAWQDVRLEVKASADRSRAHHLSLEQCSPPPGTIGLIASIFVERTGGGMSVSELIESIEQGLGGDADLTLKLHQTITASLGDSLPTALESCFDFQLARSSLLFYLMEDVPAIRTQIPEGVTGVRFTSDLSMATAVDLKVLIDQSPSTQDLLPCA